MENKSREAMMERLIKYADYLTDEQLAFIDELTNLSTYPNKSDLMKLAGITPEQDNKIDTATPIDYYRRIEELYPNFSKGNMVYDYNDPNTHGAMLNVNDLVVKRILNLKNQ